METYAEHVEYHLLNGKVYVNDELAPAPFLTPALILTTVCMGIAAYRPSDPETYMNYTLNLGMDADYDIPCLVRVVGNSTFDPSDSYVWQKGEGTSPLITEGWCPDKDGINMEAGALAWSKVDLLYAKYNGVSASDEVYESVTSTLNTLDKQLTETRPDTIIDFSGGN